MLSALAWPNLHITLLWFALLLTSPCYSRCWHKRGHCIQKNRNQVRKHPGDPFSFTIDFRCISQPLSCCQWYCRGNTSANQPFFLEMKKLHFQQQAEKLLYSSQYLVLDNFLKKTPEATKSILRIKKRTGGIILPDLKQYYGATVI